MTEKELQAWVRIHAQSKYKALMMRNNSGVLRNPDTGGPVRFGLGNDSQQINRILKSSDLIGITPIECPCGHTYGVFTAFEIKKPGSTSSSRDSTYLAQKHFIDMINQKSGIAGFICKQKDLDDVYNK